MIEMKSISRNIIRFEYYIINASLSTS